MHQRFPVCQHGYRVNVVHCTSIPGARNVSFDPLFCKTNAVAISNPCAGKNSSSRHQSGFSYVEVIIATALIAISLVPALNALQSGIQSTEVHETSTVNYYALQSKMEETLAKRFGALKAAAAVAGNKSTPTSFSDTITTTDGRQITRQVFIAAYDGDNADADDDPFTNTDAGLLWIQVTIDGSVYQLESLVNQ